MKDLIIGSATNSDWEKLEPLVISVAWSGFEGHKVLIVKNMDHVSRSLLQSFGWELVELPDNMEYQQNKYFPYVVRFLIIHRYLTEHPEFRYVFCVDTRDLIFQRNPSTWMEKHLGDKKLVAASEFLLHGKSEPNMIWVKRIFREIEDEMATQDIFCSGCIAGCTDYVRDLTLAIYLSARNWTNTMWGVDQPMYNAIMHQKTYEDITLVPRMSDLWTVNCVNLAHDNLKKDMWDFPNIRCYYDFNPRMTMNQNLLWANGIPNLSNFTVLHQYDRIQDLAEAIRQTYTLENIKNKPFRLEFTKF